MAEWCHVRANIGSQYYRINAVGPYGRTAATPKAGAAAISRLPWLASSTASPCRRKVATSGRFVN
jgi:hypothetical protein